ncbi:hypothetical protein KC957_00115 [Candidatus Saccharibacteria bacterium]|nr:hypothetical protein [Candidatus Saccharibacteria bacterium]
MTMNSDTDKSEIRERLAAQQHEIWAHWMQYLFSVCTENDDGTYIIPADKVKRWKYQLDTQYTDLTEDEKQSDREQADKVLEVLGSNERP